MCPKSSGSRIRFDELVASFNLVFTDVYFVCGGKIRRARVIFFFSLLFFLFCFVLFGEEERGGGGGGGGVRVAGEWVRLCESLLLLLFMFSLSLNKFVLNVISGHLHD